MGLGQIFGLRLCLPFLGQENFPHKNYFFPFFSSRVKEISSDWVKNIWVRASRDLYLLLVISMLESDEGLRWALTWAYFWPAVIKRLTRVLFEPNWRDFLWLEGKKFENLGFLGEIFKTQAQTKDGWPYSTWVKKIWPWPITNQDPFLQDATSYAQMRFSQQTLSLMHFFP